MDEPRRLREGARRGGATHGVVTRSSSGGRHVCPGVSGARLTKLEKLRSVCNRPPCAGTRTRATPKTPSLATHNPNKLHPSPNTPYRPHPRLIMPLLCPGTLVWYRGPRRRPEPPSSCGRLAESSRRPRALAVSATRPVRSLRYASTRRQRSDSPDPVLASCSTYEYEFLSIARPAWRGPPRAAGRATAVSDASR